MLNSFQLTVRSVFVQCVIDDSIIATYILLLYENAFYVHVHDHIDGFLVEDRVAFKHDFISLNGYYLAGVFINEIFHPAPQHASGQPATNVFM